MRIGILSSDYLPLAGGVASHVDGLTQALVRRGHEVELVQPILRATTSRPELPPSLHLHRVRVPPVPGLRGWLQIRRTAAFLRTLQRQRPCALLHWHTLDPDAEAARRSGMPCRIFTNHTSHFLDWMADPTRRASATAVLRGARWVIAPSIELADATSRAGFPRERVSVIPNGVDPQRFQPRTDRETIRARLGIHGDAFVFLCARRLERKNGVRYWVEALPHILAGTSARVRFLFVGDFHGPESDRAYVLSRLQAPPLRDHATFLGEIPNGDMSRYCAAADAAVLPSLREATSIAGLESMAASLPVLGTRIGGIPEMIDDGATGFLVEAGQPAALAEAALRLIAEPERARAMGREARARCLRDFTWDSVAGRTEEVYRTALADRSGFAF